MNIEVKISFNDNNPPPKKPPQQNHTRPTKSPKPLTDSKKPEGVKR